MYSRLLRFITPLLFAQHAYTLFTVSPISPKNKALHFFEVLCRGKHTVKFLT